MSSSFQNKCTKHTQHEEHGEEEDGPEVGGGQHRQGLGVGHKGQALPSLGHSLENKFRQKYDIV